MNQSPFDDPTKRFINDFLEMVENSKDKSLAEMRKASTDFFLNRKSKHIEVARLINTQTINGIPLRVYIPESEHKLPLLMYFHSGGWAFGSIEEADNLCRMLAITAECVVVSVGYRLAPEHQFPTPLNDCYEATLFAKNHGLEWGANTSKIGVSGTSAGGNLAAAVSLLLRQRKQFSPFCQILLHPALTYILEPKAYAECKDQCFMTFDNMKLFWQLYLPENEKGNSFASPLLAENLADLPPTMLITSDLDPMRQEGELFLKRLQKAKVPVEIQNYGGVLHAFLELPIEGAQQQTCLHDISVFLRNYR